MEVLAGLTPNASVKGALSRGTIRNEDSLRETRDLLTRCGLPTSPSGRTVHVAGTKGKGSVSAYLERLLRVHGRMRTGLFTSPHLVSPRERIRINGRSLSPEGFTDILYSTHDQIDDQIQDQIYDQILPCSLNYFRMMLLIGWEAFSAVDAAVIETGIGGRFDSTNVIDRPTVCVITSLALEHEDMLGKGLESIAWHKAGIMKPGVPVLSAQQDPLAMRVLEEEARRVGAPLRVIEPLGGLPWPMNQNAALAIAAYELICTDHTDHAGLVESLREVRWHGRQQIIKKGATTWYLDGAHTVESITAALQWLRSAMQKTGAEPEAPTLVFYSGPDKDYKSLLLSLGQNWSRAYFIPPSSEKSITRQQEMACWFEENTGIRSVAMSQLPDLTGQVFVTGSFYLVGRILANLDADLEQI